MICYSKQPAHHADWAWLTPDGFREEPFVLDFIFTDLLADGLTRYDSLPVQMDDDSEFLLRAVLIPSMGIRPGFDTGNDRRTGLLRITLSDGQQLSTDLVLTSGLWCNSGFYGLNAAGTSVVDPIVIPPGGVITLDVILATNASWAIISQAFGAASLLFEANIYGTAGNGRTIELIDPAAPNIPLSASVVGNGVEVILATDGASVITSTVSEVVNVINGTAAVVSFMIAQFFGDGAELVSAVGPLVLAGGNASEAVELAGAFVGLKRWRAC